MEMIHDLLGHDQLKIIQKEGMFAFSLDSMLLADFVVTKNIPQRIIDLGCGNAPIPLYLTLKTTSPIIGVELQSEAFTLAVRSVALNHKQEQITILQADIKNVHQQLGANTFDIVTSNPPYFKYHHHSRTNQSDFLTIARHEVKITLADIITEARKLLKTKGSLYMVHRCERLAEIVSLLEENHFGIKRIRFVYPRVDSASALLFLFEAKQNQKHDVVVEPPLYVLKTDEQYTDEALAIFNFKKPQ
ncbi:MAG: N5-glutamine S-adenosyl-L-methionine-dependent methyltransferase [Tenericutes bacterium ADurb.BinA124]|nr:MAG: N5-glutamine S-adenosyl-L-methionine-dependent methyltransferase [Tenericutes bacterium ADurb.BinA124]